MSMRLRLVKRLCAANGHQSGRTSHVIDGKIVVICNQCGEEVRTR